MRSEQRATIGSRVSIGKIRINGDLRGTPNVRVVSSAGEMLGVRGGS